MSQPALPERAAGMLAGVALGDALGMPTEFLTPEEIRAWYGQVRGLVRPHPQHVHARLPAGAVTDDTDHTLIIAGLLLDDGGVEPHALAERLLAWSETERVRENRFVGPSTSRALAAIAAGESWETAARGGITVGAAMRVAPLAIVFPRREKLIPQVVASCAVTHCTQVAISGAMAMAFGLSEALRPGATTRSVASAAQEGAVEGRRHGAWSWNPPIERRIAWALQLVEGVEQKEALRRLYELIGTGLYPWELVPCALGLAHLAEGMPMPAMLMAANMGGDTDTLASLVGSICGALQGIGAFDGEVLAQVEAVNGLRLRKVAEKLVALRKEVEEKR